MALEAPLVARIEALILELQLFGALQLLGLGFGEPLALAVLLTKLIAKLPGREALGLLLLLARLECPGSPINRPALNRPPLEALGLPFLLSDPLALDARRALLDHPLTRPLGSNPLLALRPLHADALLTLRALHPNPFLALRALDSHPLLALRPLHSDALLALRTLHAHALLALRTFRTDSLLALCSLGPSLLRLALLGFLGAFGLSVLAPLGLGRSGNCKRGNGRDKTRLGHHLNSACWDFRSTLEKTA